MKKLLNFFYNILPLIAMNYQVKIQFTLFFINKITPLINAIKNRKENIVKVLLKMPNIDVNYKVILKHY